MKKPPLHLSILGTIAYSNIFDYPLRASEIYSRLMGGEYDRELFEKELLKSSFLKEKEEYFVLQADEYQIEVRKKRAYFSKLKLAEAKTIINILNKLPTITSAYITGSLATQNVISAADDIDILIVTKTGTLWFTRLIVVVWTSLLGKYRLHGTNGEWGWCFNLWLDQSHLEMPKDHRSVYSAYEVIQAQPIVGTKNELFLNNQWIKEYINYSETSLTSNYYETHKKGGIRYLEKLTLLFAKVFERPSYFLQRVYMQPKRTKERVGLGFAFFHPRQTKHLIIHKWHERLKRLGLKKNEIEELVQFFENGSLSS